MSSHLPPVRAGDPEVLVAVCAAGHCETTCDAILDALSPVVRTTSGAVLVRATCLRPGGPCAEEGTRVRVQPWPGRRAHTANRQPCELVTSDAPRCARVVTSWLRTDRRWSALGRRHEATRPGRNAS